ncbi:THUMP-like domain-containing protein [Nonomuraea jabiensis]|uniref:SAM-dependent methyltransferase n=1 Tax=Nonomuraea jabiensis TaxID=882448 RepID=A0A7W9G4P1_9ACTN|nr:methyltransferase domain-containing protein [Nonomuraea jabiensis]MBB5777082.1 SAM-dependent methyltransferase [Nonomuraea jabiensis]
MDLDAFDELLTPRGQRALAEAVELVGTDPVAAATRLRRTYDAALTSAALTQAGLRERARAKFGEDARRMYFTPHGLEQSTRTEVAEHRAHRLTQAHPAPPPHEPAALPHGLAAFPHGPGTSPHRPDVPPHGPDTPPHGLDTPPHGPAAPSLGPHTPSRGPGAPPHGPGTPPHGPGTPPHGPAAPSHGPGTPPHGPGTPPHGPDAPPPPGLGIADIPPHRLRVVDACCGIGGDFLALARAGCTVAAVDTDPLTVAVARANAEALGLGDRVTVSVGDAAEVRPEEYDVLFADPARRTGRGRTFDPMAYSPPWPVVLDLISRASRACVKVAPGIPYEFIPAGAEAEWVSYKGEVKEAALWTGQEGAGRRATLLPGGHTLTATGAEAPVGPAGRYVYEPDGAAIRAHLVGEVSEIVNGRLLDPMIAYITGDDPIDTPWAARYEIEDILPFSGKKLRAALRERQVGNVTIKKRGSAVDIERLRADLRLNGEKSATIILTRILDKPSVIICDTSPPA